MVDGERTDDQRNAGESRLVEFRWRLKWICPKGGPSRPVCF